MAKRKLGRGLKVLLGEQTAQTPTSEDVLQVAVDEIKPNPWQPRRGISKEALEGLVDSIRTKGMLQPVVLRRDAEHGYQLVVGERRWRAAEQAGLTEIPAVIRQVTDDEMLLLALMENIQREDLNSIERAQAYVVLMKNAAWTQEQLAQHLGIARATVANTVRLLELPREIQDLVSRGTISAGHARAVLALGDEKAQRQLCQRVVREGLSVRQVEEIAGTGRRAKKTIAPGRRPPAHIRELEERLSAALGAKVTIKERRKGGKIIVEFLTHDDFDRIVGIIEGQNGSENPEHEFHV
ncbi:MAG: hypothetical protein AMS16_02550 [Planctomycetes bacterium DG_58]|nr:MAG: hypothetical protein AMS16_02550 [Planctomycetes bacterium DG_58]